MNLRQALLSFGALVFTTVPLFVFAQGLVPCGDSGRADCQFCHFAVLLNNIAAWLVGILSVVAAIIIVYAGFRLVTSQGTVSAKENAKSMITNAIIGYVIVLAAWLVVDTVMKMLLSQDQLGTWNAIQCVPQPEARVVVRSSQDVIDAYGSSSAATLANVSTFIQGDCSPESLEAAGFDTTQAQTFSCILKYESTCNLAAQNPWSSARGLFQIVRGLDTVCHNLNLPECTSAAQSAGYSVSGNLDCSTAFSGGTGPKDPSRATPGMEDLYNACNAAIVDLDCSVAAAKCLYDGRAPGNAGYGPWLGNPGQNHHLNQRACVQKYAD